MAAKQWNDSVTSLFRIYFERNKDYRRCFHRHSKWQQKMKHIFSFIYNILMPTNSNNVEWHWSRRQFKLHAFCALKHFCDGVYFKSKFVWGWFVFIFMWTFQFCWKKKQQEYNNMISKKEEIIICALNLLHGKIHWMHNFISFLFIVSNERNQRKRKEKNEKK